MTREEKWALFAALVAAGVALWVAFGRTTNAGTSAVEIDAGVGLTVSDLATRPHTCQASDIPGAVRHRHPLYRRPHVPRPGATVLMQSGWAGWVTDPPSEEE